MKWFPTIKEILIFCLWVFGFCFVIALLNHLSAMRAIQVGLIGCAIFMPIYIFQAWINHVIPKKIATKWAKSRAFATQQFSASSKVEVSGKVKGHQVTVSPKYEHEKELTLGLKIDLSNATFSLTEDILSTVIKHDNFQYDGGVLHISEWRPRVLGNNFDRIVAKIEKLILTLEKKGIASSPITD